MRSRARVQIAAATLSGNSLRQTAHTHCASVHQAAKLVAALLMVARVTADQAESNGSLYRRVHDSRHLHADCHKPGSASKQQHGFIRRRSVCTNLLDCLEDWTLNLQSRHVTDVLFFDFKKSVRHCLSQQTVNKTKILRNLWKSTILDRGFSLWLQPVSAYW